ncbi:signal peptidase I [Actinomyces vulturis]|uniref:signal peptidase I n=1 Tax=Actinomyces vulturis TaxID=1857645 RepID=UPI00082E7D27|nr:signal peptidase I [Actinomyces vulturis]
MSNFTPAQPQRREQAPLTGKDAAENTRIEFAPESKTDEVAELPPSYAPTSPRTPEATASTDENEDASASEGDDEPTSHKANPPSAVVKSWRKHRETILVIIVVLIVSALIKSFVIQSFRIPSQSMENTLLVGDYVTVAMYDAEDYTRGDVVVFVDPDSWLNVPDSTGIKGLIKDGLMLIRLLPEHSGHHLIKRVIGMPGDHVWCDGTGPIIVNGVALDETYLKPGVAPSTIPFDVVVPEGYVWVMGDNRANSADSRYHESDIYGGFVPMDKIVGPATTVVWPLNRFTQLDKGEQVFDDVPAPSQPAPSLNESIEERGIAEQDGDVQQSAESASPKGDLEESIQDSPADGAEQLSDDEESREDGSGVENADSNGN